jgi:rRNA maturation endonuclease Nob1
VEADFLFCPGCGQNLLAARHYPEPPPPPLPKTIICPHCSRRLDTDFLFCPECGQTLEQRPAAPPAGAG